MFHRFPLRSRFIVLIAGAAAAFALAACHRDAEHYLSEGDAAMKATKLADAEIAYQEAVKIAPDDPRTHIALGSLYELEHKAPSATAEFMKVLELDPRNPAAHFALGGLYLDQGQSQLAEEQYRAAVALDSAKPGYRMALGDALARAGKSGAAEAEMRTAIGLDPKNAQAHLALGTLLGGEQGRGSEAQAEFDQARALDPSLFASGAPAPAAASAAPPPGAPAAPAPATAAGAPAMPPMPAAPGAAASPPEVASAPAPAGPKIKPIDKLFMITKNSPVYSGPDQASAVVGKVVRRKYTHVIGITGDWLQIKLKDGTVGFIPIAAAE